MNECEMSSVKSCVLTFGLQLVALFGKVMEPPGSAVEGSGGSLGGGL